MNLLQFQRHIEIADVKITPDTVLPGLDIYWETRKVVCGDKPLELTSKEFDLLSLLAFNKNHTLTYEIIYQKIWHEESLGRERNPIRCHIWSLRKKISSVLTQPKFAILCIKDIGYCLKVNE